MASARRPALSFRLLLPVLSIAVTLAAAEIALALFHPVPFPADRNLHYEPDPFTGFRHTPGILRHFESGIPALANANGHRDDLVTRAKPPGVFRLLVLGDSFTVGTNVRQEDAYPQVLERMLAKECGRPVEVVNAGVGGWEPFQYAQYFEHYGVQFQPDLVVIGFYVGNDAFNPWTRVEELPTAVLGRRVTRKAAGRIGSRLLVFLNEHLNLARLFMRTATGLHGLPRQRCDEFDAGYLALQRARISNHLRRDVAVEERARNGVAQIARIQALAARSGAAVVVALLPDESQINPALQAAILPEAERPRYDFAMPQSLLREEFARLGLATVDLLPAFRADPRCLYMNDTHWTPEGHVVAAEGIRAALVPLILR